MERVNDKTQGGPPGGPLACAKCGKTFSRRFSLKRHLMTHTGEKPYSCYICKMTFNQASTLKGHMRRHEERQTAYQMKAKVSPKRARGSASEVQAKACTESARSSATKTETHTKGARSTIKSARSLISGTTKTDAQSGKPKVLKIILNRIDEERGQIEYKVSNAPNYECTMCRTGFMHSASLQKHMNIHASSIKGPVSIQKVEKRHECPMCGMKFGLLTNLQNHIRFHKAELESTTHDCPFCDKKFTSQTSFIRHQRSHFLIEDDAHLKQNGEQKKHGKSETHQANGDEAQVQSEKELEHHTTHLCVEQLNSVSDMGNHMQTGNSQESPSGIAKQDRPDNDADEKRHKCPLCPMKFGLITYLQKHMRSHKAELESDTHDCPFCTKKFSSRSAFTRHQRSHFLIEDGAESRQSEEKKSEKSQTCLNGAEDLQQQRGEDTEQYTCCFCRAQFDSVLDICNHMQVHCSQEQSKPGVMKHNEPDNQDDESMPELEPMGPGVLKAVDSAPCLTVEIYPEDEDNDDECMPELIAPNHPYGDRDPIEKALPRLIEKDAHDAWDANSERKSVRDSDPPKGISIDGSHEPMPCLTAQHGSNVAAGLEVKREEPTENRMKKEKDKIIKPLDTHTTAIKSYCMDYIKREDSMGTERYNYNSQSTVTTQRNIFEMASLMKDSLKKEQPGSPAKENYVKKVDIVNPTTGNHSVAYLDMPVVRTMRMKGNYRCSPQTKHEGNDSVVDGASPNTTDGNKSLTQFSGAETDNHPIKDTSSATKRGIKGKAEVKKKISVYYKCGLCSYLFVSAEVRDQHMKSHLVKKLLKCMACGVFFADTAALEVHLKTNPKCSGELNKEMKPESFASAHSEDKKETETLDANPLPVSPVSAKLQTWMIAPSVPHAATKAKHRLDIGTEGEVSELQTPSGVVDFQMERSSIEDDGDLGHDEERAEQINVQTSDTSGCEPEGTGEIEDEEESQSGWELCADQESSEEEDEEGMDDGWELQIDNETEANTMSASSEDTLTADVKSEQTHHTFRICGDEVTVLSNSIKAETAGMREGSHSTSVEQPPKVRKLSTGEFGCLSNQIRNDSVEQSCVKTEQPRCEECGQKFDSLTDLSQHEQEHQDRKAYQCSVCDKKFYEPNALIGHSRIHTQEDYARIQQQEIELTRIQQEKELTRVQQEKELERMQQQVNDEAEVDIDTQDAHNCGICGKEITPSARDIQLMSSKGILLKCTECYDRFYKQRIEGDVYQSTGIQVAAKRKWFAYTPEAAQRKRFKNTQEAAKRKRFSQKSSTLVRPGDNQLMKCVECGEGFHDLIHLSEHMEKHRQGKAEKKPELKQRIAQRYYCSECGEHFKHLFVLKAHLKTHSKEECYKCPYCDLPFASSSDLSRHILLHTGEKFYRCGVCKTTFFKSTELSQHVLQQHNEQCGNRPFECAHCGRRFSAAGTVTAHIKSHIQNPHYKCRHCEMRFDTKADLAIHTETHAELRPVVCYACNANFTRWNFLKMHVTTVHRNYQEQVCPYCGDYCTDTKTINEHLRNHAAERQYVCTVCGEKFELAKSLTLHTKTHKVKLQCMYCNSTFRKTTGLKSHMRHCQENVKKAANSHSERETQETDLLVETQENNGRDKKFSGHDKNRKTV